MSGFEVLERLRDTRRSMISGRRFTGKDLYGGGRRALALPGSQRRLSRRGVPSGCSMKRRSSFIESSRTTAEKQKMLDRFASLGRCSGRKKKCWSVDDDVTQHFRSQQCLERGDGRAHRRNRPRSRSLPSSPSPGRHRLDGHHDAEMDGYETMQSNAAKP